MSVNSKEFQKSLEKLQDMAKGTQLYHTDSDSNPSSWVGGSQDDVDEDESHIDDRGTDYNGVRKSLADKVSKSCALTPAEVAIAKGENPLPAIGAKLAKGETLTPAENWAMKGGYHAASGTYVSKASTKPDMSSPMSGEDDSASRAPKSNAGATEDEVEDDAQKSFARASRNSLAIQQGLEMSPFLYELVKALGSTLGDSESRVAASLAKSLDQISKRLDNLEKSQRAFAASQDDFNGNLAGVMVEVAKSQTAATEQAVQQASLPAYAPKSYMGQASGVQVINKSYDGPANIEANLSKAQISNIMTDLVKGGSLSPLEVVKFESTGEISAQTKQKVAAKAAGN